MLFIHIEFSAKICSSYGLSINRWCEIKTSYALFESSLWYTCSIVENIIEEQQTFWEKKNIYSDKLQQNSNISFNQIKVKLHFSESWPYVDDSWSNKSINNWLYQIKQLFERNENYSKNT